MTINSKNAKLESKLTEIAFSYIEKLEESDGQLFIYIERGNDIKNNYYKYVFYSSSILNENLNLPYRYVYTQGNRDVGLFFFDKERERPKDMKERLKKDSLWVSLSDIDRLKKDKLVIKLSHMPVWDVFICKENIEKFEIVESAYGIEDKEKVTKVCN